MNLNFSQFIDDIARGKNPATVLGEVKDAALHELLHLMDFILGEEFLQMIKPGEKPLSNFSFSSILDNRLEQAKSDIIGALSGDLGKAIDPYHKQWALGHLGRYFNSEETFVRMIKIRRASGALNDIFLNKTAEAKIDAYFASSSFQSDETFLRWLWQHRNLDTTGSIKELFLIFF